MAPFKLVFRKLWLWANRVFVSGERFAKGEGRIHVHTYSYVYLYICDYIIYVYVYYIYTYYEIVM